jgi:hypothetical protein
VKASVIGEVLVAGRRACAGAQVKYTPKTGGLSAANLLLALSADHRSRLVADSGVSTRRRPSSTWPRLDAPELVRRALIACGRVLCRDAAS